MDKLTSEELMRLRSCLVSDQQRRLDPFYANLRLQWTREIDLNANLMQMISTELKRRVKP